MTQYNPAIPPEPAEWREFDEQLRVIMVEEYHNSTNIKLPNVTLHAVFHVIVENQVAEGVKSTVTALARLTRQGVSRHNAIHAIGSVLVELIHDEKNTHFDQAAFDDKVARLKARDWKKT